MALIILCYSIYILETRRDKMTGLQGLGEWMKEVRAVLDEYGLKNHAKTHTMQALFSTGIGPEDAVLEMIDRELVD